MQARLDETLRRGGTLCIPAGVIAQAMRSSRQVRLAGLLKSRDIDIAGDPDDLSRIDPGLPIISV
jgi:hypothetical protein